MAFLLGLLIGVGRLAGDCEIIALRSCGVGPGGDLPARLGGGGRPFRCSCSVSTTGFSRAPTKPCPGRSRGSRQPRSSTSSSRACSARSGPASRFSSTASAPTTGAFEGVFVARRGGRKAARGRGPARRPDARGRPPVARPLHLGAHEYDAGDPSRYRMNRSAAHRILFAGDIWNSPRRRSRYEKALRAQSLGELAATAKRVRRGPRRTTGSPGSRSTRSSRFPWPASPSPSSAFRSPRRRGEADAAAGSPCRSLILVVLLRAALGGEILGPDGTRLRASRCGCPTLLLLLACGAIAMRPLGARALARWRRQSARRPRRPARGARRARPVSAACSASPPCSTGTCSRAFCPSSTFAAAVGPDPRVIVDYADHIDKITTTTRRLRGGRVLPLLPPLHRDQIAPFAALIATLVALGILSRSNEDTAFKASGVSLYRLGAPVLVPAIARPSSSRSPNTSARSPQQRGARYRNVIYGRPVDYGVRVRLGAELVVRGGRPRLVSGGERPGGAASWWPRRCSSSARTSRSCAATRPREACWSGRDWVFRQGWTRTFGGRPRPRTRPLPNAGRGRSAGRLHPGPPDARPDALAGAPTATPAG